MNIVYSIADLRGRRLLARLALLSGAMASLWAALLVPAADWHGPAGVAALSLAAGACLASAVAAMLIGESLQSPSLALAGVLLPMSVRIMAPLFMAVVVRLRGAGLVEAGFAYYLIAFYLLALAVEVPLSLPRMAKQPAEGRKPHG